VSQEHGSAERSYRFCHGNGITQTNSSGLLSPFTKQDKSHLTGAESNASGCECLCDPRVGRAPEAQNFILGVTVNECLCDTN